MIPHIFYLFKEAETHSFVFTSFFRHVPNNPMTRGSKHLNKNIFLPSALLSIHPPSPQNDKNNPVCELQFDARFPAAMGMCGRQTGSLATGCSYLRLVQTKNRGGLIFLGVGAAVGWGKSSPSMPKKQAVPRVVVAFIPPSYCWLFYGTEGLTAYLHECRGAEVPLA